MDMSRQNPHEAENRGRLKIFFGYAAGVGKTYAMLKAALRAKEQGIDVVLGYVDTHDRAQTKALADGLEQLQRLNIDYNGITLEEFDLNAAIARKPQLVIVDELAHTNAPGCRHAKRYQDVEELLKSGIDVYTTVNVQHIESLNDDVCAITGIMVRERIPDSVFDGADQVELVDIEPQDLIERLKDGDIYKKEQAVDNLTALREIALRRCADRMNLRLDDARLKNNSSYHTDEHILVCLSPSPSNAKIIRTAARMASAFRGMFTALFVETPDFQSMDSENKNRLRSNIRLAQQLGAKIETVYGEDIAYQISEFARLSGVSKIVMGRSEIPGRKFRVKPPLTEQLIEYAPNVDIHIIPDTAAPLSRIKKARKSSVIFSARDILKSIALLITATCLGMLFQWLGFSESNIIMVYILSVLIISTITRHKVYSLVSSIASVIIFNFLFTEPRLTLLAYDKDYIVTFPVMFIAALITGTLAARLKNNAKQSVRAAYRTRVLLDTNQLLSQASEKQEALDITAEQLIKLLEKNIVIYPAQNGALSEPHIYPASPEQGDLSYLICEHEAAVADWVLKNNKHAGATTDTLGSAQCLYLAIRINNRIYGVIGIEINNSPLDNFENGIVLSILGECALALENEHNITEKKNVEILAKNEQLRANLLRAISHDLRTPLTSILGNASNLTANADSFDEKTRHMLYTDIYDDSMWLINLVENLLAVTKLEEGKMNIHMSAELMDEVIAEALKHINRKSNEHNITVKSENELLLAKMDSKLIVQVIINLVDNAIKYTPKNSAIEISAKKKNDEIIVSVSDNGLGINDNIKPYIFDMFFCGENKIADSHRSLGLGLYLCKSIIEAHGGKLCISDNMPHGAVFTFTLPAEEVTLYE
ncbi:MAG: sensor histidine kinase KdpD [Clostridiales bacterium]|nr:sensor histidine kinase KdpD [Clostridiales bacterium]